MAHTSRLLQLWRQGDDSHAAGGATRYAELEATVDPAAQPELQSADVTSESSNPNPNPNPKPKPDPNPNPNPKVPSDLVKLGFVPAGDEQAGLGLGLGLRLGLGLWLGCVALATCVGNLGPP